MKKINPILIATVILALVILPVLASAGITQRGVTPESYPGNFVSSDDDQVCYDMSALGYIGEVTSEMRGFKIDPPASFDDGSVAVTLSTDGKSLDWEALNATVLAFIVKGGPNYNVYNYVGTGYDWDMGLMSPVAKKQVPQISHYNVCYQPNVPEDFNGCTPGYWRNHHDRWATLSPGADFDTIFGVDLFSPDITLAVAIELNGGGVNALARHATAALLNAYGGVPNADGTEVVYPYTPAQVYQMVLDAVTTGDIEGTKDLFEDANELGCPLSGTSADKGNK